MKSVTDRVLDVVGRADVRSAAAWRAAGVSRARLVKMVAARELVQIRYGDHAIHTRRASKADMRRILTSCAGWPGTGRARSVVDFANGLSESVFESCARVVFHEHGLPPPQLQVTLSGQSGIEVARVDFFWGKYQVVAETDGMLKYKGGHEAIAELRRDRLLREAGFEVVHLTWEELFYQQERVVARVRAAFARALRLRSR